MTLLPDITPQPAAAGAANMVIKCAGVNKTFSDFWLRPRVKAVVDVNLEVRRGEVFGLLGPNGSGKSTTIKLILGLLHPTAGRIAVFGKRPEDVATKELIGYLPEESYLYRFLNARETLDYYGRLFHLPRHTRHKRIDMLLEMVGLDAAQHRPVGEYSKGMQRRIGLAQALINQPQLLILDEPTTGMDPIGAKQMKDLILRLKERGITILLCSHLLADVEDVCDRVTIMFGGRVVEEGTIDELLTERDITSIEASQIDDETIQQIEQVLAKRGKHIERVSHRRQTLEQKFLDLVERERSKGSATSGARSGGKIAGFLFDDDDRQTPASEESEGEAIIDELTRPEPAATRSSSNAVEDTQSSAEASRQQPVDSSILSELSGVKPAGDARAASRDDEAQATSRAVEPEADLSVLEGLIAPSSSPSRTAAPASPPVPPPSPVHQEQPEVKPAASQAPTIEPLQQAEVQEPPAAKIEPASQDEAPPKVESPRAPAVDPPMELPPKPQVSRESGESGLGLLDGLSADDEEFDLPPIDPPQAPPRSSGKSGEKPDAGFLKALDDVDADEDKI